MEKNIKVIESYRDKIEYNNFIRPLSLINAKNISKHKIFLQLLPIEKLANKLHIDKKRVLKTIDKLLKKKIVLSDLLSYAYTPTGFVINKGVLVAEKCATSSVYKRNIGFVEKYYDVYLVCNANINVTFNLIFRTLLAEIFPNIFIKNSDNGFLFKEDFKYTLEERKCLENLPKELSIYKIPIEINQLSVKEIATCINNRKRINEIVFKTRISSYFDSECIYLHLFYINIGGHMYSRELYVPIEALFTKDYEAIANEYITSQAVINENGVIDFINGAQKDMPYFKNERTQKILKYILS